MNVTGHFFCPHIPQWFEDKPPNLPASYVPQLIGTGYTRSPRGFYNATPQS